MARKYAELRAKMLPESRARAQAETAMYLYEMALGELRAARDLTQANLAKKLRKGQPAISKMESSTDMYVSTLRDTINAMGGVLEMRAVFSDATVLINQFSQLGEAKPKVSRTGI
jgi:transcriptional regulator with XRE-family HTH domain